MALSDPLDPIRNQVAASFPGATVQAEDVKTEIDEYTTQVEKRVVIVFKTAPLNPKEALVLLDRLAEVAPEGLFEGMMRFTPEEEQYLERLMQSRGPLSLPEKVRVIQDLRKGETHGV